MSYTITQQATTPNAAYTRLLYAVSGSIYTTQPQFQYVMDVYESGSSNLIKRTTQTINPAGVAIFDPSRIIQGELSVDYNWKINSVTQFNSSSKEFIVEFGEQFATSISSSVTVYPNIASSSIETFQGVVEPNAGYYNWDSASYAVLSNMPATMSMQTNDYGTVSLYNNTVVYVSQSFYSASSVSAAYDLVEQNNYTITDNFSSVPISASTPYWNYVDVNVSSSVGLESYRYEASDETHREKTRFAFVNKLGAWDYYNNYNPVRQAIDVKREQYTAPRVDYSSLTSTYDISRRGRTDVHNITDDMFTVDTDLLDKTNANWLEELIESPSVYIQRNGEFIPIVITDSSYVANQNQARQKQFKYTINFKPSNQPFGTWIPEYVQCPKVFDPCNYTINTVSPSSIAENSLAMLAYLTASAANNVNEVGFYYSSTNTNPGPSDSVVTKPGVVAPFTASFFDLNVTALGPDTTYYYRGYGKSANCDTKLGNVISATTLSQSFDPTLDGEVSPYFWYDFADASTFSGGPAVGQYTSISSKGTNSGSLAKGPSSELKYNSSNWTEVLFNNNYSTFNNNVTLTGKNSTLARKYGTGDYANDSIFNTGSSFTAIHFTQPLYNNTGTNDIQPLISFKAQTIAATASFSAMAEEISFLGAGINGTIDITPPTPVNKLDFISTDTTNFTSMSYFEYEAPQSTNNPDRDYTAYSYNGTAGGWQSSYQVYNSGSSNTLKVGREPISSSQNFVTSSAIFNDAEGTPNTAEGLTIGSRAFLYTTKNGTGTWAQEPYEFGISHFIMYDSALSNDQIQRVIDNYSSSYNPVAFNTFEN